MNGEGGGEQVWSGVICSGRYGGLTKAAIVCWCAGQEAEGEGGGVGEERAQRKEEAGEGRGVRGGRAIHDHPLMHWVCMGMHWVGRALAGRSRVC